MYRIREKRTASVLCTEKILRLATTATARSSAATLASANTYTNTTVATVTSGILTTAKAIGGGTATGTGAISFGVVA